MNTSQPVLHKVYEKSKRKPHVDISFCCCCFEAFAILVSSKMFVFVFPANTVNMKCNQGEKGLGGGGGVH